VLFVPDAKLIAVVPPSRDRIVLHRFDVEAALDRAEIDYLFVTSRPPVDAPGKSFSYPVVVKSKKGGVKMKL
jgi:hypothetical protein